VQGLCAFLLGICVIFNSDQVPSYHRLVVVFFSFIVIVLCSNASVSINVVIQHWARLVLGWVTIYEHVNHVGM